MAQGIFTSYSLINLDANLFGFSWLQRINWTYAWVSLFFYLLFSISFTKPLRNKGEFIKITINAILFSVFFGVNWKAILKFQPFFSLDYFLQYPIILEEKRLITGNYEMNFVKLKIYNYYFVIQSMQLT